MTRVQQVKRCRKEDKINNTAGGRTWFESKGHRDALRKYTAKTIPAVPSGVRFADYSTVFI